MFTPGAATPPAAAAVIGGGPDPPGLTLPEPRDDVLDGDGEGEPRNAGRVCALPPSVPDSETRSSEAPRATAAAALFRASRWRRLRAFQRILTAFSVLPVRRFAISAHRFPTSPCRFVQRIQRDRAILSAVNKTGVLARFEVVSYSESLSDCAEHFHRIGPNYAR